MASRRRIRPNSRPTGLIVAGAIALMLAGVVLLVAINSKTRPRSDGNELPLDISATPPGGGDVVDISAQATGRFQAVDKDDPTRIAWELLFSKLDPIGAGVYRLSEPRAWIYLKDGQTLFVRADTAQIKKPAAIDGQIESGEFVGNTVAMVFPKRPEAVGATTADETPSPTSAGSEAAAVWDPDRDIPWLLARTHSVKFDTVLLELSSDTPVKMSTRDAQLDGKTMLVRGNQVRNRLEFMKIGGPGTIRYTVARDDDAGSSTANATAADSTGERTIAASDGASTSTAASSDRATATAPSPSPAAASQPEEYYRAVFSKEVVLVQTGRKLNADMLELWARIIDNKFPAGAFGESDREAYVPPTSPKQTLAAWTSRANQRPRASDVQGHRYQLQLAAEDSIAAGETLFRPTGDDIVLNWGGGGGGAAGDLAITPLMERPSELAPGNELLSRFTAAQTGRVKFQDRATGAVGQSGVVEYAATARTLTLRTDAPRDTRRAWVHLPGSGLYTGEYVDVSFPTGKVRMTGEGLLASIRGTETSQDVFAGIALATPESLAGLAQTRRMTWRERADFQFATRNGVIDDQLQKATFLGTVRAEDNQSSLEAEQMEADFVRVGSATTNASKSEPRTTPAIRVFGAGKFTHALPQSSRKSPTDPTAFEVTWTKSMFFDDAPAEVAGEGEDSLSGLGRIECDGDAVATGSGPFTLDVLKSHRVRVDLGRVTEGEAAAEDAVVGDRRIVRIEAIGASFEREGGKNASIESRRYAPGAVTGSSAIGSDSGTGATDSPLTDVAAAPATPRRLEQIIYLDGPRIIADDIEGTLRVPSEGRALFVDQRMAETAASSGATESGGGGASSTNPVPGVATGDLRGTTKFEWKGSMVYRRASGIVNLLDTVEMVHKPMDNQPFARLTCNELEALVGTGEPAQEPGASGSQAVSARAGKLTRATAIGNVYIESQDRKKLVAERATYDAERSIIEASADGANLVSMFDESQAVPMVARKMRWDLAGDRIEITEPAPTTVPR